MIAIEDESDETENTFGLSVKRNFLMELYSNISDVIFFISFFFVFFEVLPQNCLRVRNRSNVPIIVSNDTLNALTNNIWFLTLQKEGTVGCFAITPPL